MLIKCCDHDLAKQPCQEIRAEELQKELPATGWLAGDRAVAVGWASLAGPADLACELLRVHFLLPPPRSPLGSPGVCRTPLGQSGQGANWVSSLALLLVSYEAVRASVCHSGPPFPLTKWGYQTLLQTTVPRDQQVMNQRYLDGYWHRVDGQFIIIVIVIIVTTTTTTISHYLGLIVVFASRGIHFRSLLSSVAMCQALGIQP